MFTARTANVFSVPESKKHPAGDHVGRAVEIGPALVVVVVAVVEDALEVVVEPPETGSPDASTQ